MYVYCVIVKKKNLFKDIYIIVLLNLQVDITFPMKLAKIQEIIKPFLP